jgi:hypothetical protein
VTILSLIDRLWKDKRPAVVEVAIACLQQLTSPFLVYYAHQHEHINGMFHHQPAVNPSVVTPSVTLPNDATALAIYQQLIPRLATAIAISSQQSNDAIGTNQLQQLLWCWQAIIHAIAQSFIACSRIQAQRQSSQVIISQIFSQRQHQNSSASYVNVDEEVFQEDKCADLLAMIFKAVEGIIGDDLSRASSEVLTESLWWLCHRLSAFAISIEYQGKQLVVVEALLEASIRLMDHTSSSSKERHMLARAMAQSVNAIIECGALPDFLRLIDEVLSRSVGNNIRSMEHLRHHAQLILMDSSSSSSQSSILLQALGRAVYKTMLQVADLSPPSPSDTPLSQDVLDQMIQGIHILVTTPFRMIAMGCICCLRLQDHPSGSKIDDGLAAWSRLFETLIRLKEHSADYCLDCFSTMIITLSSSSSNDRALAMSWLQALLEASQVLGATASRACAGMTQLVVARILSDDSRSYVEVDLDRILTMLGDTTLHTTMRHRANIPVRSSSGEIIAYQDQALSEPKIIIVRTDLDQPDQQPQQREVDAMEYILQTLASLLVQIYARSEHQQHLATASSIGDPTPYRQMRQLVELVLENRLSRYISKLRDMLVDLGQRYASTHQHRQLATCCLDPMIRLLQQHIDMMNGDQQEDTHDSDATNNPSSDDGDDDKVDEMIDDDTDSLDDDSKNNSIPPIANDVDRTSAQKEERSSREIEDHTDNVFQPPTKRSRVEDSSQHQQQQQQQASQSQVLQRMGTVTIRSTPRADVLRYVEHCLQEASKTLTKKWSSASTSSASQVDQGTTAAAPLPLTVEEEKSMMRAMRASHALAAQLLAIQSSKYSSSQL